MPAQILTQLDPDWLASLSDAHFAVLPGLYEELWLRPEQRVPAHRWRTCGFTGGRGFGKTIGVARWINARVMAGLESHVALIAPTEDRVDEVQFAALIAYANPGQAPERYRGGLRWPNGVEAIMFTPEAPGRSRSENLSLSWATELVDWKPSTREEAFNNLYTATRVGEARFIWDSTAKGRNEVRAKLEAWNEDDPEQHVIMPGTMFDNPLLSTPYLRSQWLSYTGVRREEELMGRSFRESAGALWKQAWFDTTRVTEAPAFEWFAVCVDPATSTDESADETGIVAGGRAKDDHAYATVDASGKWRPEEWGDRAIALADPRQGPAYGRIGIERKKIGDHAASTIKSRAENRGLRVRVIGKDEPWPAWDPSCIFIREYSPQEGKGARAEGPAVETEAGRVHLVDPGYPDAPAFADLEKECTTFVPGQTRQSPNRLDAFAYLVTELRELRLDSPPDHRRDAEAATAMQRELDARLRGATRGQVVSALATAPGLGVARGGRRMGL
jgi:phage terminase large subunit-like protein